MSNLPAPFDDKPEPFNLPVAQGVDAKGLKLIEKMKRAERFSLIRYRLMRQSVMRNHRMVQQRLDRLRHVLALRARYARLHGKQHLQLLKNHIPTQDELILLAAVTRQVTPRILRKAWDVTSTSTKQFYLEWRQSLEKQDERAFMPAALEIIDTAASPTGRKMMHFIMLIVATFSLWSWFGEVDIVAVAPGKIIPKGRTQVIQSLESGTVRMIAVRDGQRVSAGQTLIELDDTALLAELSRGRQERIQSGLDMARLQSILEPEKESSFFAAIEAPTEDIKRVMFHMKSQRLEHARKLSVIDDNLSQREAEREQAVISLEKINSVLPLLEERANIRQKGAETQFGSRLLYLEIAQQLLELKSERIVQQQRLKATEAASQALISQKEQANAEFITNILNELNKSRIQYGQALESEQKAGRRLELTRITAPINGTVQDLSINTIGGVVSSAQQLLRIVPEGDVLEASVVINNQDVGFVTAGQNAEIKIDAFPFTRYGLLSGTVAEVSRDARSLQVANNPEFGPKNKSDETENIERGERLVFTARILLQKHSLNVNGEEVELLPGMSMKAEIKTGKRRLADFFLAPLRQYDQEIFRER
jgi:hemolysin D